MDRKFLAFDLAVAKWVPDGGELNAHRPLGISCAAMLLSDTGRFVTWHGGTPDGDAASRMTAEDAKTMVQTLVEKVNAGYSLLSWNGLSFDFPVMAEESGLESECQLLSSRHVDMMFHVYCVKGQYLDLKTAATGMRLTVRTQGMAERDAPRSLAGNPDSPQAVVFLTSIIDEIVGVATDYADYHAISHWNTSALCSAKPGQWLSGQTSRLWAEGKHRLVLDHLAENLRTTTDLALTCERRKVFLWINRRGSSQGMDLPSGWLTVPEAARIKGSDHTQWQWDR